MADTIVDNNPFDPLERANALWGPYWLDADTGVVVFIDAYDELAFARTVNQGVDWAKTAITSDRDVKNVACWYDKETPGNNGALVHIAWLDRSGVDFAYYITLDVSDASLGTQRTVDDGITVDNLGQNNRIAITRTVSGNIIYAFSTQDEIECYKSDDLFATAGTDIADVFEAAIAEDWVRLYPAATGDDNDACALFGDRSVSVLSVKMYDDSGDVWDETAIGTVSSPALTVHFDGAVRHSDSHLLVAAHWSYGNPANDLFTWDLTVDSITDPTVTAKTNIFTDQDDAILVSVFIDQTTDDVYVAYCKGGTPWASVDVVYHKSDDGMDSWGAEEAYSEDGPDDFRLLHSGHSVGSSGGHYMPSFYDIDDNLIFVNLDNAIDIEAEPVTAAEGLVQVASATQIQRAPNIVQGY